MKPVLLTFGPLHLYSYGASIAIGILIALFLMKKRSQAEGFLGSDLIFDMITSVLIWGFAGARLFYVAQNISYYWSEPLKVFAVWEGGLIFYGGAITAVLGLWAFVREKKIPFLRALDFIVPYGVLTHAFGRIGCFLNGCCYGKTCALPWAVTFPGMTHPVHPTQLYEAFYNFALAFFLIRRRQNPHFEGQIALLYFLLYGFGRYLLEFLREPAWTRWGLTANQWLSMVIIVVAFLLFPIARKKTR